MRQAVGVGLGLLVAWVGLAAVAAEDTSPPPTAEQLQARVAELDSRVKEVEAALEKSQEEAKTARLENGRLVLENGRLRRMCEHAGIDPSEKAKVDRAPAPTPGERIDPAVAEFLERVSRRQRSGDLAPSAFIGPVGVGSIGSLTGDVEIVQIVDGQNALVQAYVPETVELSRGPTTAMHKYLLWLRGLPTEGLIDGQQVHGVARVLRVVGTKQYNTAAGSKNTVFELEPFDVDAYLASLCKQKKPDAGD